MTKVNNGIDAVALSVGGNTILGKTGTATSAPTTTTLTDTGAAFTASSGGPPQTGGMVGMYITDGNVYGVILQNTTTIVTVDYWHNATAPGTVGTTPANGSTYLILPGGAPCWYLGFSTASRAIAAADAFLTNDGSTISEIWNASGVLNRARAAFAHTLGTATYTISSGTLTTNANDPNPVTVRRIGIFQHGVTAAPSTTTTGIMLFETDISNAPVLVQGDSISVTDTVTIS